MVLLWEAPRSTKERAESGAADANVKIDNDAQAATAAINRVKNRIDNSRSDFFCGEFVADWC
jgi:hypothetical protein